MRELVKSFSCNDAKVRTYEGKTKIVLTNVLTGKRKVIEHKNTFQSAVLSDYMRSLGVFDNNPFGNSTWSSQQLWRNLCGGILLFEDEIQAPAKYPPTNNKMIGNGSFGVSNAGTPSELGSYNSIESSTGGSNSLSFVYDWGTSQANGTISCVCLTSEIGGYIGIGNASGQSAPGKSAFTNQNSNNVVGFPYDNNRYSFSFNTSTYTLTVTKTLEAITAASLFNGQRSQTINYTYSSDLFNGSSVIRAGYIGNGKFYIYRASNVPAGGTFGFIIYDATSDTFTEKRLTNATGNTLNAQATDAPVPTENNTVLFVNNTAIIEVNVSDGTEKNSYTITNAGAPVRQIVPGIYKYNTLFVDIDAGTVKPANITAFPQSGVEIEYNDSIDALMNYARGESLSPSSLSAYKNPFYLATINNLDSPVTKDSTQTMKVIYTLTEAS